MAGPTIEKKLFKELADILNANELTEIEYDTDAFRIRLAKHAAPQPIVGMPAPAVAPVATLAPAAVSSAPAVVAPAGDDWESHAGAVKSPMVGVVYTAKDPASPVFVQEGDTVKPGQTLFLIEAMKTFNPVKADKAGKVLKVLVTNGQPVEYGETLVVIG